MIFFIDTDGHRRPVLSKGTIYEEDWVVEIPEFNSIAYLPSPSLIVGDVILAEFVNGSFISLQIQQGCVDYAFSAQAEENSALTLSQYKEALSDIQRAAEIIRNPSLLNNPSYRIPAYLQAYLDKRAQTPRKRIYIIKSENVIPVKITTKDGKKSMDLKAEGDSKADISIVSDLVEHVLGLKTIGYVDITGVGGDQIIPLAIAKLEFMGEKYTTEVGILPDLKSIAGTDVLLGNDLLISTHSPRKR